MTDANTQHESAPLEGDLNAGGLEVSVHLETVLAQHAEILNVTRAGLDLLLQADRLACTAGFSSHWLHLVGALESSRYSRYGEVTDRDPLAKVLPQFQKALDASAWDYLLRASGIRTFMDAQARKEWSDSINKSDTPPFRTEHILATFAGLYASRGDMVERGIITLFRALSWHYKSNQPQCLGRKLIVKGVLQYRTFYGDSLDDLVRALCFADGKPEPDHRRAMTALLHDAAARRQTTAEAEYFLVRWFKNGNAHITFKPEAMPLVDRLNGIVARHYPGALPP